VGFKVRPKVYRLRFEDGSDLDGATIMVRSLPTGDFLHISGLADRAGSNGSTGPVSDTEEIVTLLDMFAGALVEWDLEREDGTPVPCDSDGLRELDLPAVLSLIFAWIDAVVAVAAPLAERSPSGGTFPVASLPMETSSPSPGS
jgi:hypothetical protein